MNNGVLVCERLPIQVCRLMAELGTSAVETGRAQRALYVRTSQVGSAEGLMYPSTRAHWRSFADAPYNVSPPRLWRP